MFDSGKGVKEFTHAFYSLFLSLAATFISRRCELMRFNKENTISRIKIRHPTPTRRECETDGKEHWLSSHLAGVLKRREDHHRHVRKQVKTFSLNMSEWSQQNTHTSEPVGVPRWTSGVILAFILVSNFAVDLDKASIEGKNGNSHYWAGIKMRPSVENSSMCIMNETNKVKHYENTLVKWL